MRAWMAMATATAMFVGVGVPGTDRVVPLPVYAAEQATDQAAKVLADMRKALGGSKVDTVKALSLEGPFRRDMGGRQVEGTLALTLQGPDRMHKSEENEFPGGMSVERIQVLAGESAWVDMQNRGGMGGGMQIMMRNGPPGAPQDPAEAEKRLAAQFRTEMQRWMFALLGAPNTAVTYAGVAESPDGKADTLEIKDARGQAVRLFVDQETHMPLMLTYSELRPRIMMRGGPGGGPGGRRGGGPGGPGGPGGAPQAGAAPAPGAGTPPPPPPAGGAPAAAPGEPGAGGERRRPTEEEIRQRMASMPPPAPSAVRMTFDEFDTFDGVKLPKHISIAVDGTPTEEWTIEKIKVNPSIKAELFQKRQ